jgi:CheY-like chemotaxis protein
VAATAPKTEAPPTGCETVLVVEDNAALRRVCVRQLTDLGYRVIEAECASAALEMLAREKIDFLFSDVVMPGEFDGFALARHVVRCWPSVKVVLTSGFPETNLNGSFGAPMPAVRMLSKPYRKDELARAIREALDP